MSTTAILCLPAVSAAVPVLLAEFGSVKGHQAMTNVQIPPAGDYRIDKRNSTISFATRHLFGLAPVRGTFELRDGRIHVAAVLPESTAHATIAAASMSSGNPGRDDTVRSPAFLDARAHPDITFLSDGIVERDGDWMLRGSLTVRDTTRPSELRIQTAAVEHGHLRLVATTQVDRYEFGLTKMKGMAARRLSLRLTIVADRA